MVFYNLDTFFSYKNSIHFKHDKSNTASLAEATPIHQYLRDTGRKETAYSLSHNSQISMGKKTLLQQEFTVLHWCQR